MIGKFLLIVTTTDLQQLDLKKKSVIYIETFVQIYNWYSRRLVHKIHGMVKLEKYPISRVENPLNLRDQQFYKISEALKNTHVVPKDIESNTFYLNSYIN